LPVHDHPLSSHGKAHSPDGPTPKLRYACESQGNQRRCVSLSIDR